MSRAYAGRRKGSIEGVSELVRDHLGTSFCGLAIGAMPIHMVGFFVSLGVNVTMPQAEVLPHLQPRVLYSLEQPPRLDATVKSLAFLLTRPKKSHK